MCWCVMFEGSVASVGSVLAVCCVAGSGGCWWGCHCIQSARNSDTATALQEDNVSISLSLSLLLTNISNKYLNIRTGASSNILFSKSSGTMLFYCFLFYASLLYIQLVIINDPNQSFPPYLLRKLEFRIQKIFFMSTKVNSIFLKTWVQEGNLKLKFISFLMNFKMCPLKHVHLKSYSKLS